MEEMLQQLARLTGQSAEASARVAQAMQQQMEAAARPKPNNFSEASKVVKQPEAFSPSTQDEELSGWPDWKLAFKAWITYADPAYKAELKEAEEAGDTKITRAGLASEEAKKRSDQLLAILTTLLRKRPLKILKSCEADCGYDVWRELARQFEPKTRTREISLLQAFLQVPAFTKDRSLLEQILGLERVAEEYDKVSKETLSDSVKLSVLLRCLPTQLRTQLQLGMDDSATYDTLREKALAYDRTQATWSPSVIHKELDVAQPLDTSGPMEVDRISKGKGKEKGKNSKGKGKEKGKDKGKGKGKSDGKGKGFETKGKGKGKDKMPKDMCKECYGRGHWSKECPYRVRLVNEAAQSVDGAGGLSPPAASSTLGPSVGSTVGASASVRRVELAEEVPMFFSMVDDYSGSAGIRALAIVEEYDMTVTDDDGVYTGEEGTTMDLTVEPTADRSEVSVRMVTGNQQEAILLDSGADMSVLPERYGDVGRALPTRATLRDAQGTLMRGGQQRKAQIVLVDNSGAKMVIEEVFAISNVDTPLLAAGKLLRKGWSLNPDSCGGVSLAYGTQFEKSLEFRRNSLILDGEIRCVRTAEDEVRAIQMNFYQEAKQLSEALGWKLSTGGLPILVEYNAKYLRDGHPFERSEWPLRSTFIKPPRGQWEAVELSSRSTSAAILPKVTHGWSAMTVLHKTAEDLDRLGEMDTGDVEVLEAAAPGGVEVPERSLEDGVYNDDDDEEQPPEEEGAVAPMPLGGNRPDPEQIQVEGWTVTDRSTLRALRDVLGVIGLSKHGSKAVCWRRLCDYKREEDDRVAHNVARDAFLREPPVPRGQVVPAQPDLKLVAVHELTHWPYQPWCQACIAGRGRDDHHQADDKKDPDRKMHPVMSMDFFYTFSSDEVRAPEVWREPAWWSSIVGD